MFKKLKDILSARISITIVYPGVQEYGTTTPRVIEVLKDPSPKHCKSDFRFIEVNKTEFGSPLRTFWATERLVSKHKWETVIPSISHCKEIAMGLHLEIINGIDTATTKITTVLWEGLDKDETETWVKLNSTKE